ncbi:MAG: toprim domain-containing protein, partial [bacterium]|nr:toprim domain-containing protein [bacterium]
KSKNVERQYEFTPQYVIEGKERKETARVLTEEAKKAEKIYLATDPDREGEAIAWHIKTILGDSDIAILRKKGNGVSSSRNIGSHFFRIAFHEITETAIHAALETPRDLDMNLVDAQQARRVLDRLVGYKLSPLLWA